MTSKYQFHFSQGKINYDSQYHHLKFNRYFADENYYQERARLAKDQYFSQFFNESAKVLEFGCGLGQNIALFKNRYGYDLNKDLYPLLKKKGIVTFNSLKEIPNNFFDEILISQVLEHLEQPLETLKELQKKLKKEGHLRLVLPKPDVNPRLTGKEMNTTKDGHIYGGGFYEANHLLNLAGYQIIANKRIYHRGVDKLFSLSSVSYSFYKALINFYGHIVNDFDLLIIAKK